MYCAAAGDAPGGGSAAAGDEAIFVPIAAADDGAEAGADGGRGVGLLGVAAGGIVVGAGRAAGGGAVGTPPLDWARTLPIGSSCRARWRMLLSVPENTSRSEASMSAGGRMM